MNYTEMRNPNTSKIDQLSTENVLKLINEEDQKVAPALAAPQIIQPLTGLVDSVVAAFQAGGRLFYVGAGTSGRLGILDASECVPTFGVSPSLVQGLIAGGSTAITHAVEGAEDSTTLGAEDLKAHGLTNKDVVIGLAASGRTPYVISGLKFAQATGCVTGAISCNSDALISQYANYPIEAIVGPEILTGSTRMKAGTAQKLLLNMISTTAMIKIGKTYSNLMVDLQPTNSKLVDRAQRIIAEATGVSKPEAHHYYLASHRRPKVAILMILAQIDENAAEARLADAHGRIADSLNQIKAD
ncbi:N-acetylmuramic acid 6-phosphate etherase [Lacticaseibacillus suibinensis]|uniref:N-acetylmuramic acid 6-phosphate etherase n=1 Tax=Lacticaseibacillus suibinensis TaxID=2486011 RepID=UPI000F76763E|nr:N-acetylmuramic acid 6-phosphate etherase [Lacticaseibacillus suibinensis]